MSFNLDPSKQAQEVLFSNKVTKTNHPNIIFNGNMVQKSANQKHLGLILDKKRTLNDHITSKLTTVKKLTSTLGNFIIICHVTLLPQFQIFHKTPKPAKSVKDWNNLQNKAVFKFNQEQVYTPKLISTLKKIFLTSSVTSLLQIKHFVFLSYFFCLQNIAS